MTEDLRLTECSHSPQGAHDSGGKGREMNRMNCETGKVNNGNMHELLRKHEGGLS